MGCTCSTDGSERRECVQKFGSEPEGKRPLGRTRRRWEDNGKIVFERSMVGRCGLDPSGSG